MSLGIDYDDDAAECRECGRVYYGDAADFSFQCRLCAEMEAARNDKRLYRVTLLVPHCAPIRIEGLYARLAAAEVSLKLEAATGLVTHLEVEAA